MALSLGSASVYFLERNSCQLLPVAVNNRLYSTLSGLSSRLHERSSSSLASVNTIRKAELFQPESPIDRQVDLRVGGFVVFPVNVRKGSLVLSSQAFDLKKDRF